MPKSNQPRQSGFEIFFKEVVVEHEVKDGGMKEDGEDVGYSQNTYMKFSVN